MPELIFSFAMVLAGFVGWLVTVFLPKPWTWFVELESQIVVKLGLPTAATQWLKKHETGSTLKVVLVLLTLVSAACIWEIFWQMK